MPKIMETGHRTHHYQTIDPSSVNVIDLTHVRFLATFVNLHLILPSTPGETAQPFQDSCSRLILIS